MLRNYFTLYHAAMELHERLAGSHLSQIYSEHKNEVCIDFVTSCNQQLQIVLFTHNPLLCLSIREGKTTKTGQSASLMTELSMQMVTAVAISPSDREIHIGFSSESFLVLQLFSSKTNLFLVRNNHIIDAFKHKNSHAGQVFLPVHDAPGILRSLETLAMNKALFLEQYKSRKSECTAEILKETLPGFDRSLVEELLRRTEKEINPETLYNAFQSVFFELLDPEVRVTEKESGEPEFSLLHHAVVSGQSFDSVLHGLSFYCANMLRFLETKEELKLFRAKVTRQLEKKQKTLDGFNPEQLDELVRNYEESGHLLMAALYQPRTDRKSITVKNIFDHEAADKIIPLKEALSIQKNAEEYFLKASRTKGKQKIMMARHAQIRKEKAQLEELLAAAESISSPKEARRFIEQQIANPAKSGEQALKNIRTAPLFRTVNISASITLLVGKNAANNDLLTFSHTKPNDIWLHARKAAGSHCVLKGTTLNNLGAIRQAAEIAAWYSTAKHSELVPVIYTLKKYVRRGKKLAPGQVIVEREEVLLVRPSNKLFNDPT